jgi:hypothetical protein
MSHRIKPYQTNQTTWYSILNKNITIPMNQREYSWENEEIKKFLDDILHIYKDTNFVEKMGTIINYTGNDGNNEIYDGQQRTLTTVLILLVIGNQCDDLKSTIYQLLSINTIITRLSDTVKKQIELLKDELKIDINTIPKIYCVNPYDRKALFRIFNNDIKNLIDYIKNISDFQKNEDCELLDGKEYICKECDTKVIRKNDFKRHLIKTHQINIDYNNKSKLYNAFKFINEYIKLKNYDSNEYINLYNFIVEDIDIQIYNCNDPFYVSKIFDWENNRGKDVEILDIIKNPILTKISDDKKEEIYDEWEKLKNIDNDIYKKNFGIKLFDIAIQIYKKQIVRIIKHEEMFDKIIRSTDVYSEIKSFFKIIYKLNDIYNEIKQDRFGRLLNNNPRINLNWEAYMWCLLPIFYIKNGIDKKLIKLLTKWFFRNIFIKSRNFNSLSYSNELIKITQTYIDDETKKYDYYKAIKELLINNINGIVVGDNFKNNLIKNIPRSSLESIKYTLLFLETCITTDANIVNLDLTLEHIFPQKNKDDLKNIDINDIGNLTLLEGTNSQNGHKGNSSCGANDFIKKLPSYKNSHCTLTKDIVTDYKIKFDESDIITRRDKIINLLDLNTKYDNKI